MSIFKTWLKTSITPIALGLSLSISGSALAKGGHHQKHDGVRQVLSELSLSQSQKQDIKQIMQDTRADRKVFMGDVKIHQSAMRDAIHSEEWDEESVTSLLLEQQQDRQNNTLKRATNLNQIWNLLSNEQQTEFAAQMENRNANKTERRKNKKNNNRRFEDVGLSQSQQDAIEQIKASGRSTAAATREQLKTFKQAERDLIHSADFDSSKWQALNTEYQSLQLSMALNKAKTQHDIWHVLTPEQQTIIEQKKIKRQKKRGNRQNVS